MHSMFITVTNWHCWCPHRWYRSIPDLPDFHLLSRGRQPPLFLFNCTKLLRSPANQCEFIVKCLKQPCPAEERSKAWCFPRKRLWFSATQTFSHAALRGRNMFSVSTGIDNTTVCTVEIQCVIILVNSIDLCSAARTLGSITACSEVQVHLSQ